MKKKLFTHHVCILISDEMFEKIKKITDLQEESISAYFRNALKNQLSKEK